MGRIYLIVLLILIFNVKIPFAVSDATESSIIARGNSFWLSSAIDNCGGPEPVFCIPAKVVHAINDLALSAEA